MRIIIPINLLTLPAKLMAQQDSRKFPFDCPVVFAKEHASKYPKAEPRTEKNHKEKNRHALSTVNSSASHRLVSYSITYRLYPENTEDKYADIALQDSLGRVYYLNNTALTLSMYQRDSLRWKCDFNKNPISFFLHQRIGLIRLNRNDVWLMCHPCTAFINRETGVQENAGCD